MDHTKRWVAGITNLNTMATMAMTATAQTTGKTMGMVVEKKKCTTITIMEMVAVVITTIITTLAGSIRSQVVSTIEVQLAVTYKGSSCLPGS